MLKNNRGLGIIEVMVAASIMLVVVLGSLAAIVNNNKAASVVGARSASTALGDAIRTQLSMKATCRASFTVAPSSWTNPSEVKISLGDVVVGAGEPALENYDKVLVESLSLGNLISIGTNPTTGLNYRSADVRLKTSSKKLSDRTVASGADDRFGMSTKTIAKIIMETDASGNFLNCYTSDPDTDAMNMSKSICEMMGGDYIYNESTKVGRCQNTGRTVCQSMGGTFDTATQKCNGVKGGKSCPMTNPLFPATDCQESMDHSVSNTDTPSDQWDNYVSWKCTGWGMPAENLTPAQMRAMVAYGYTCTTNKRKVTPNGSMTSGTTCKGGWGGYGYGSGTGTLTCLDGYSLYEAPATNGTPNSPEGSSCFTKDSLVLMADGSQKRISEIRSGDWVQGHTGINKVVGIENVTLGNRRLVSINGSDFFASEEHPFASTEGWVSINPGLERQNDSLGVMFMGEGQTLIKLRETEKILSLRTHYSHAHTPLFNLLLDGDHTYYVNDYLVHNKDSDGDGDSGGDGGPE